MSIEFKKAIYYFTIGAFDLAQRACQRAEETAKTTEQKEKCQKIFRYITHIANGEPNSALRTKTAEALPRAAEIALKNIDSEVLSKYSDKNPDDITAFIVLKHRRDNPCDSSSPLLSDCEDSLIEGCRMVDISESESSESEEESDGDYDYNSDREFVDFCNKNQLEENDASYERYLDQFDAESAVKSVSRHKEIDLLLAQSQAAYREEQKTKATPLN